MKKEDAFLCNECFVLAGFVLSLNDYEIFGVLMGIFAIGFSFHSLSVKVLKKDHLAIIIVAFIQLLLLEITYLNQIFSSMYFLSLASLIVAFTWNHAGYKAIHYGMKCMNFAAVAFAIAIFVMPYRVYTFFQTVLIISFIFLPSNILYMKRQLCHYMKQIHRQRKIAVVK